MNCLCVFTLILVSALCDYVSITQQLGRNVLESEKVWQDIAGKREPTSGDPFLLNPITNNGIINVPHGNHLNRRINQKGKNQKSSSLENLNKNNRVSLQSLGLYKLHRQPGISKLLKDYFNHIRPTMMGRESSLGSYNLKYSKPSDGFTLGDSSKWSNSDPIMRAKDDSDSPRENWKFILDALVSQTKPVRLRDGSRAQTLLYKEPYLHTGHLTNSVISDLLNNHNISKISSFHQAPSVNRINFNKNLSDSLSFKNTDNLINHAEYSDGKKFNSRIGGKTILQLSSLLENSLNDKIAHLNTAKSSLASSNSPLNTINLALIAKALCRNSDRGLNFKTNIPKGHKGKNEVKNHNSVIVKLLNTPDVKDSIKSSPSFEKENKNSKISIITSKGASIDSVSSPLQTDYKTKTNCLDALSARMSEISNLSLYLSPINKSQITLTHLKELADQGKDLEKNRLKLMTENLRRFLGEQNIILKPSGDPIKENIFIDNLSSQSYTRQPSDGSSVLIKNLPSHSSDLTGCVDVCYESHPNDKQVQENYVMFKGNAVKASSTGIDESTSRRSLFRNGSIHSTQFLNNLIPLLKSSSNLAIRKYSLDSDNVGIRNRVMNMGKSTMRLRTDSDTTCSSILDDIESIKHIPLSNSENRSKTFDIELISTTEGKIYLVMSERSRQSTKHQMTSLNKSKLSNSSRASEFALNVDSTTQTLESHSSTRLMKDSKAQLLFETTKESVAFDKSNKSDFFPISILKSGDVTSESIHTNCNFTESYSLERYALTTELDSSLILNHEASKTSPKKGTANSNSLLHSNSDINLKILESNIMNLISNFTESNEVTTSKEDKMFESVSCGEYFTTNYVKDAIDIPGNLDKVTISNKEITQNTSNLASPSKNTNNRTDGSNSSNYIAKLANGANFETNKKINPQGYYQEIPTARNLLVSSNYKGMESISGKNYINSPFNEISNPDSLNNGIKYLSADRATLHSSDYLNMINLLISRLQDNVKDEKKINSKPSFLTSFESDLVPNILAKESVTAKGNNNINASNCSETMFLTSNQTENPGYKLLEAMRAYVVDNASSVNNRFSDPTFESLLSDPQMFLKSAILNTINQINNFPSKFQCLPFKNEPKDMVEKIKDSFMCTDPTPTKNLSLVENKELDTVPKNVLDMMNDANVKGIAVVLISLKPTEATTLLKKTEFKNPEKERGLPGTALLGANATIVIDVSNGPNHADDANETAANFRENNAPVGMKVNEVTLFPVFPLYPVYPIKPILSNFTQDNDHEVRS